MKVNQWFRNQLQVVHKSVALSVRIWITIGANQNVIYCNGCTQPHKVSSCVTVSAYIEMGSGSDNSLGTYLLIYPSFFLFFLLFSS